MNVLEVWEEAWTGLMPLNIGTGFGALCINL